jgi:hypothetical protein
MSMIYHLHSGPMDSVPPAHYAWDRKQLSLESVFTTTLSMPHVSSESLVITHFVCADEETAKTH